MRPDTTTASKISHHVRGVVAAEVQDHRLQGDCRDRHAEEDEQVHHIAAL